DWSDSDAPDRGVYRGHAGWRAFVLARDEALGARGFETIELLTPRPDTVVLVGRVRERGRTSGAEVAAQGAAVFQLRDGKVSQLKLFQTSEDAFRALERAGRPLGLSFALDDLAAARPGFARAGVPHWHSGPQARDGGVLAAPLRRTHLPPSRSESDRRALHGNRHRTAGVQHLRSGRARQRVRTAAQHLRTLPRRAQRQDRPARFAVSALPAH